MPKKKPITFGGDFINIPLLKGRVDKMDKELVAAKAKIEKLEVESKRYNWKTVVRAVQQNTEAILRVAEALEKKNPDIDYEELFKDLKANTAGIKEAQTDETKSEGKKAKEK